MSIGSEILRIQHNIANAYAAVSEKGGEVPLQPTSENLPEAINTIPGGGDLIVGDGLSKEGDTLSVTTPVRSIVTQAEFDALPEEQRSSGLYVISDGGSGGGTTGEVYSTEETRIGTWIVIDGKTAEIPSGGGVTMEQVNAAIDEAITGAIEEVYYGTDSSAEAPVQ